MHSIVKHEKSFITPGPGFDLEQFVCLFDLMLYVPVNSNGHVGTTPPFYGTFTQH